MNIGHRIVQRLQERQWERKDLLDAVPDLTPQALSNLIRRDSKRSEWDEAIASALDVSVLWLVYGQNNDPVAEDEQTILKGYRLADAAVRKLLLGQARDIIRDHSDTHTQPEATEKDV